MGICEDAPDEYCGYILQPDDVGMDVPVGDVTKWHKAARNAVCIREPKYDGLCVWHADTDEKDFQELEQARVGSFNDRKEGEYMTEHLSGAIVRGVGFSEGFSFAECVLINADFRCTTLERADFRGTNLRGSDFEGANVTLAGFLGSQLTDCNFQNAVLRRAKFTGATVYAAEFSESELQGAEFHDTELAFSEFPNADIAEAEFRDANLHDTSFSDANLRGAEFLPPTKIVELYEPNVPDQPLGPQLEDAQLGPGADLRDVDFSGARLYQASFRNVRINDNTTFGLKDQKYGEKCRYEYDPNAVVTIDDDTTRYEAATWTYRRLESLFEENAMDERARNAHIRKQEAQRRNLRENEFPPDQWLRPAGQYLVAKLNWHVHRHGESLRRLLGVSGMLIFLCGIVYSVSGIARQNSETYRITVADLTNPVAVLVDLLNGWYFSVITFSTIGYGDFYPASPVSRLLVGVESLAGALFIALFVFVIGRRVAR